MNQKLSLATKIIIFISASYGVINGIGYLIEPRIIATLRHYDTVEPEYMRMFGATIFALGISGYLTILKNNRAIARVIIKTLLLWCFISMIIVCINMIVHGSHGLSAYLIRISIYFTLFIAFFTINFLNDKKKQ